MTTQSEQVQQDLGRPGSGWKNPEKVQDFLARMQRHAGGVDEPLALLTRLIPFAPETPLRVLDLGAGYGRATAAVLGAFPQATSLLIDMSEVMIATGREQLAAYAGRYHYLTADIGDGDLPAGAEGPFDAVISTLAMQYVSPDGKRRLFQLVRQRLAPGGCFLNSSLIGAPDPMLQALYERVSELERLARGEPPWRREGSGPHRWQRQSLDEHLDLLREAGFAHVDCFWKRLGTALVGGYVEG